MYELLCFIFKWWRSRRTFRLPIKGGKLNPIGKGLYAVIDSYDNDRPIVEGLSEEEQQKK